MATIKSFTSLEQSKRLAEILPIESADMVLLHEEPYETSDSKFDGLHQALCVPFSKYDKTWRQKYKNIHYFPCWSLTALLGVLPNNKHITTTLSRGGWKIEPVEYIDKWFCEYEYEVDEDSPYKGFTVSSENPVDACYEMIIRLHELNLL